MKRKGKCLRYSIGQTLINIQQTYMNTLESKKYIYKKYIYIKKIHIYEYIFMREDS